MRDSERLKLVRDIEERWPHSTVVADAYRKLGPLAYEHAFAAIEALEADKVRFAPSAGEIINKFAELLIDPPRWGAVLAEARARQASGGHRSTAADERVCPVGQCTGSGVVELGADGEPLPLMGVAGGRLVVVYGDGKPAGSRNCVCREQMVAEIRASHTAHPLVAGFLVEIGPRKMADVLAGDHTADAQARRQYEEYVQDVVRTISYMGIDHAELPALKRLQQQREEGRLLGVGRSGKGLHKPSMTQALGEGNNNEEADAA